MDAKAKTVDAELEKANFAFAGRTICEVWTGLTTDGYPVLSEYVEGEKSEVDASDLRVVSPEWRLTHIRESQYCTHIMKCSDRSCCRVPRSSMFNLLPSGFLPPPVPVIQTGEGLKAPDEVTDNNAHFTSVFMTQYLNESLLPRSLASYKRVPYAAYCHLFKLF